MSTETVTGRMPPHIDSPGLDVPGGIWVRVGRYPSGLWEQELARWVAAHGSPEQNCVELGTLARAFNEGDHNEEGEETKKILHNRGWQTFSVKGKTVNIFSFVGHIICAATTRLCHCSTCMRAHACVHAHTQHTHRRYANGWAWPCSNKTLFPKTGGRLDLTLRCSYPTPAPTMSPIW